MKFFRLVLASPFFLLGATLMMIAVIISEQDTAKRMVEGMEKFTSRK